jgi:hypothetical protein
MGNLSELRVNLHKSEILIMTAEQYETQQLMQIMECRASTFPIKYLGLPLSNKKIGKRTLHGFNTKVQSQASRMEDNFAIPRRKNRSS